MDRNPPDVLRSNFTVTTFHPERAPYNHKPYSPFEVHETDKTFPDLGIDKNSWITEPQYNRLHALAVTAALSNIGGIPFGKAFGHVVYPFEYAARYQNTRAYSPLTEKILSTNKGGEKAHILEIGGQEGNFSNILLKQIPQAEVDYTIVDLDLTRRDKDNIPAAPNRNGQNVRYIESDAQWIKKIMEQFKVQTPDAVVMNNVAHVMFDPMYVLAEVWDKLKPGGMIYLGQLGTGGIDVPVVIETSRSATADALSKNTLDRYGRSATYLGRDYQESQRVFIPEWQKGQNEFVSSLPQTLFTYNSEADYSSESAKAVVNAYDRMPFVYPKADLAAILKYKGCDVTSHMGSSEPDDSFSCLTITKKGTANPFRDFRVLGVGKFIGQDNVFLPQIYRSVHIE